MFVPSTSLCERCVCIPKTLLHCVEMGDEPPPFRACPTTGAAICEFCGLSVEVAEGSLVTTPLRTPKPRRNNPLAINQMVAHGATHGVLVAVHWMPDGTWTTTQHGTCQPRRMQPRCESPTPSPPSQRFPSQSTLGEGNRVTDERVSVVAAQMQLPKKNASMENARKELVEAAENFNTFGGKVKLIFE